MVLYRKRRTEADNQLHDELDSVCSIGVYEDDLKDSSEDIFNSDFELVKNRFGINRYRVGVIYATGRSERGEEENS